MVPGLASPVFVRFAPHLPFGCREFGIAKEIQLKVVPHLETDAFNTAPPIVPVDIWDGLVQPSLLWRKSGKLGTTRKSRFDKCTNNVSQEQMKAAEDNL